MAHEVATFCNGVKCGGELYDEVSSRVLTLLKTDCSRFSIFSERNATTLCIFISYNSTKESFTAEHQRYLECQNNFNSPNVCNNTVYSQATTQLKNHFLEEHRRFVEYQNNFNSPNVYMFICISIFTAQVLQV